MLPWDKENIFEKHRTKKLSLIFGGIRNFADLADLSSFLYAPTTIAGCIVEIFPFIVDKVNHLHPEAVLLPDRLR